jgi:hypothetical protein
MASSYLIEYRDFPVGNPPELERVLTQTYIEISQSNNIKDTATYETTEIVTGQQFFNTAEPQKKRFTYRQCYVVGAIAAGATLLIPHGIVGIIMFTRMYGTCITNVVDYRPIPMVSATVVTDQVSLRVVGANIEIVNGATAPNITSGVIVLEYLRT